MESLTGILYEAFKSMFHRFQRSADPVGEKIRDSFASQLKNLVQSPEKEKNLWESLFRQYARKKGILNSSSAIRTELFIQDMVRIFSSGKIEENDLILVKKYKTLTYKSN